MSKTTKQNEERQRKNSEARRSPAPPADVKTMSSGGTVDLDTGSKVGYGFQVGSLKASGKGKEGGEAS